MGVASGFELPVELLPAMVLTATVETELVAVVDFSAVTSGWIFADVLLVSSCCVEDPSAADNVLLGVEFTMDAFVGVVFATTDGFPVLSDTGGLLVEGVVLLDPVTVVCLFVVVTSGLLVLLGPVTTDCFLEVVLLGVVCTIGGLLVVGGFMITTRGGDFVTEDVLLTVVLTSTAGLLIEEVDLPGPVTVAGFFVGVVFTIGTLCVSGDVLLEVEITVCGFLDEGVALVLIVPVDVLLDPFIPSPVPVLLVLLIMTVGVFFIKFPSVLLADVVLLLTASSPTNCDTN